MAWYDGILSVTDQLGLSGGPEDFNFATDIHLPAWTSPPVDPNSNMSDAELRTWRLQNAAAFSTDGIQVTPSGDLKKITNWNPLTAAGAIVPDTSVAAQIFGGSGVDGVFSKVGDGLRTIAIGGAIFLGVLLVIVVVKR